ncbi:hypothetical protein ACI2L4_34740 [Streptomyces sparsogenes]|uniref:hypothetical protein n=1 Tax=Streptomyces sparsogenes TaxID=67365 RepID=UPI0033EA3D30
MRAVFRSAVKESSDSEKNVSLCWFSMPTQMSPVLAVKEASFTSARNFSPTSVNFSQVSQSSPARSGSVGSPAFSNRSVR